MLKDRSRITTFDRPRSSARQWLTALGLVGLTLGVATLRGPALAAEEDQPSATMAAVAAPEPGHRLSPFGPLYLREGADGVAIFRPAAAFRHKGLAPLLPLIREEVDGDLAGVAKSVQVDPSRPGFLKLRAQDIEWVTAGVHFGRDGTGDKTLHRFMLSCTAVRMIEPFNWLAFLHQWKIECKEVHLGGRAYYKLSGKVAQLLGPNDGCVFLPDDRTIVVDGEAVIRKIVSGEMPNQPDFLRSQDWERANRGLVAFAIKSQDDAFAKHYDLGRPDDAVVLSLFRGIDSWILSVDDADAIVLHADAACHNREAGEAVSRSLESLIELGRRAIANEHPKTPDPSGSHSLSVRMIKGLLAGLRVQHTDTAITVQTQDFGTLADFAAVVDGEVKETKARTEARKEAKAKNALKR